MINIDNNPTNAFLQIELLRRKLIKPKLIELGLTVGQGFPRILKTLRQENAPINQKELADKCFLDVTTMSRALDKLEQTNLIKRSINPDCRRSWLISLTDEGIVLADKIIELFLQTEAIICKDLTNDEISSLLNISEKVINNLTNAINDNEIL